MIGLDLGFQIDSKDLSSQISSIQREIKAAMKNGAPNLSSSIQQAKVLEKTLERATGADGKVSFINLNAELRKMGTTAGQLTTQLAMGGASFRDSLNAANNAILFANRNSLVLSDRIHTIAHTIKQSFKYSMAQALFRSVSKFATQSIHWVKDLNESITQIGVVTGKTSRDLDTATEKIIKGAKELKVAAKDYADASFIFYQQGLNDREVERRTEITIKAARAAGQEVGIMSEQLTAVWNTYQMNAEQQANAASVGAKLAASTAAEFSDISSAMQLSAAAAEQMGVSYNSLAAIIATVKDTTQQSASIIGNAYKTIFSRFEQLKSAGTDGEVTLGQVSKQLQNLGVQVLDNAGNLRQLDQVINEVGTGWDKFTEKQQLAIAQAVGGTRQYGQFLALMNNFDKYQKNLAIANTEMGTETLDQQYQKSLDSIEALEMRIKETFSRAGGNLFNEDNLKDVLEVVQTIAEGVEGLTDLIDNIPQVLAIIAVLLRNKIGPFIDSSFTKLTLGVNSLSKKGRQRNDDQILSDRRKAVDNAMQATMGTSQHTEVVLEKDRLDLVEKIYRKESEIQEMKRTAIGQEKVELELHTERLRLLSEELIKQQDIQVAATATYESNLMSANIYNKKGHLVKYGDNVLQMQSMIQAYRGIQTGNNVAGNLRALQDPTGALSILNNRLDLNPNGTMQDVSALMGLTSADTMEAKLAIENVVSNIVRALQTANMMPKSINAATTEFLKQQGSVAGVVRALEDETALIKNLGNENKKLGFAHGTINRELGATLDKQKLWSNLIGGAVSGISSLAMGYTSVVNLAKTLTDETATTNEKIGALAFGLPMILTSAKALVDLFAKMNKSSLGLALTTAVGGSKFGTAGALLGSSVRGTFGGIRGALTGIGFGAGFRKGALANGGAITPGALPGPEGDAVRKYLKNQQELQGLRAGLLDPYSWESQHRQDTNNKIKALEAELVATQASTQAAYKNAAANLEEAQAKALLAVKIVAVTAVIAALVAAIIYWNKHLEKNTERAKENLDETVKAADALDEQTRAVNDNYAAWRKAVEAGEDASSVYSTLSKSLAELSDTLLTAGISAAEYQSAINMAIQTGDTFEMERLQNLAKANLEQKKLDEAALLGKAQIREKDLKIFGGNKSYQSGSSYYSTYGKNFSNIRNDILKMEQQLRDAQATGDKKTADDLSKILSDLKDDWKEEIENAEQARDIALGYYEEVVKTNEEALNNQGYKDSLAEIGSLYTDLKSKQDSLGLTDDDIDSIVRLSAMQNKTLSKALALYDKSAQFGELIKGEEAQYKTYDSGVDETGGGYISEGTEDTIKMMDGLEDLIAEMTEAEQEIFLSLDAKLFESADAIEEAIDAIQEYRKELKETYETQEELQGKIDKANNLQSGLKSAIEEMKESGEVSVDTAEDLIEAGLGKYLTEVEGKFYLTKGAANAFNSSLDEEREAVSRMLAGTTDLRGAVNTMNEMFIQLKNSDIGGGFSTIADGILEVGKAFMDSEGSVENFTSYLDSIQNQLLNFTGGDLSSEEGQKQFVAFEEAIATGMAGALQKATAALDSGKIKLTEYQKILKETAQIQLSQKKLSIEAGEAALKKAEEDKKAGKITEEEYARLVQKQEDLKESSQGLQNTIVNSEAFNGFFETMYDVYEELNGILEDDYTFKVGVEIDQAKFNAINSAVNGALNSLSNYVGEIPDDLAEAQEYFAGNALTLQNITDEEMQKNITALLTGTQELGEGTLQNVQICLGNVLKNLASLISDFNPSLDLFSSGIDFGNLKNGGKVLTITGKGNLGDLGTKLSNSIVDLANQMIAEGSESEIANGVASLGDFSQSRTAAIGSDFRNNGSDKGGSKAKADYIKRYENIERQLDKMTKAANRYKEAADDAFGKTKIIALQKYEQELQKIGKLNQQLLDEAQRYQKIDQLALEQQINSAGGPQVTYGSDGRVNNAEAIRTYWHEAVKNTGSEAVKEVGDKVIELLDKLLGSEDKVEEVWDESLSNIRDWMSNKLEVVKQQIERAEKIADTEIKRFEMMNDLLGDMALSDGSVFKNLKGVFEQNVAKSTSISAATDRLLEIQSNIESGSKHEQWFKDQFGPEAWDAYISGNGAVPAELEDMLREQLESLMDLATEMKQNLADMFEAFQDTLQFFLDQYDDIAKEMKNNFQYLDRLEAIMDATSFGKTKEGLETKAKISRAREEQTQRDIDFAMSKRNVAKEAMDQAEAVMKAAMNGKTSIDQLTDAEKIAYDLARKNFNEARDTFYQTEEDLTEALNNGLEQAKETLEIMNQLAEKTFSDKIGGFSLDSLKDEYDMQKTMDNFYLDAYEKEYSLSKLENEIAEQMKDVDDPSRLKAWGEFQDKLNGLRANGVKLTQDEYEILEAEFELEKLRDQYEEAKNAKNTMRLARDASGNYSYVYSSNSKEVNKLAQQIKDAEHNIYEMHKNIEQEMQDSWWELQEWYKNNIENFDKELYETDAKYKAYIDAGQAYYEMMNARYAGQITTHTDAIGIKFEETATGKVLPACQTMDQAAHDFKVAFCGEDGNGGYKGALIAANNDYLASVKSLAEEFGIDMADMRQTAETEIDKINEKNDELIDKLTGDDGVEAAAKNALKSAGTNLKSFVTNEFLPNMQKILDKIAEVTKALNDFENRESGSVDVDTPETPEIPGTPETPGTPGTPGTPSSPSSPTNDDWWKAEYNAAKSYDVSYIKAAQRRMGLKGSDVDGSWGPASQTLAKQLYGTYSFAKVWEKLKAEDQGDEWDKNGEYMAVGGNLHEGTVYHSEELEATKFEGTNYWKIKGTNFYAKQSDLVEDRVNGNRQFYVPANTKYYVIKKTASGGLISTPQIRSLAEEGPELVLNAEDTKNILATVKMMREVVARQSNAVRGADFASRVSSDFFNQHQTVDQDVKIEATFPNVSMASEIEAAFNNLINEAVQYATRR